MNKKIIFVTGGARSGKSSFALAKALGVPGRKAYIATAEALDKEMTERIEQHKKQRGKEWDTYEEPLKIAEVMKKLSGNYSALVLDCLTLWLSNLFMKTQSKEYGLQAIETEIQKLLDSLRHFKSSAGGGPGSGFCSLYIVSNEVGMGIVPENETARKFRDMAGIVNQKIAEVSDEVYMMVAGISMKVKGKHVSGDD
ncbi:MAG: bifunctional adenosylcobinamide kinase/adenosylcobinamide-phosphate guanylyltransferase [Nitrospirales bacterium]|nr:MAG: bifunctional adenosylcobinamide kinase/adenosylcobinamide-phosphate guanylyltransferase [Nitrospirales bacterium]